MKRLTTVAVLLSVFLFVTAPVGACEEKSPEGPPQNIALGKSYTVAPKPNYDLCTDPLDNIQLTDGKVATSHFWTQKGTVGWTGAGSATITIDLGKVEPIDRVAFTCAAGAAQVTWPAAAIVLVSEDGKKYYETGGNFLIDEQHRNGAFDNSKYSIRKLTSNPLATRGRYVRLYIFSSSAYLFTDEVEVYRGSDRCLNRPLGKPVTGDIKEFADQYRLAAAVQSRYLADVTSVREMVQETVKLGHLNELKKNVLEQRINLVRGRLLELPAPDSKGFRAILPLNEHHAQLLAVQAQLWSAAGMPELSAEVVNRWELLPLVGRFPTKTTKAKLDLLRGESRPIAVNLYNSSCETIKATVSAKMQNGAGPKVEFAQIPWTDTIQYIPVQAAIVDLAQTSGKSASFDILPGVPCQLWVTVDSHGTAAGSYPFDLNIEATNGTKLTVEALVEVYPFDMPAKSSLLVGGWDYTDGLPAYNITQKSIDSFMQICRKHHVNAPWSQRRTMLDCCTVSGNPKALTVDTKVMENWLARWPEAKEYFVFLAVGQTFCGFKHGTPEFNHWLGEWARFWGNWFKGRKIDPSRVSLLVIDEPGLHSNKDPVDTLCDWARAIKNAGTGMKIWEDPVYTPPTKGPAEIFNVSDTLCPNRPQWLADPKTFEDFYLAQQKKGKTLHLYSCSGPLRLLDPYHYCLLQAWHCFKLDAKASFFWALTDGGGYSCWNEYALPRNAYCPMFIDPEDPIVYSAKQMAAIKESVQDYETLLMLKNAIATARANGTDSAKVERAAQALVDGVEKVLTTPGSHLIAWNKPGERETADTVRNQLLNILVELNK